MTNTGSMNPMVAVARATYAWTQGHGKQPGRRFGPAPESSISGQGASKGRRELARAAKRAARETVGAAK